MTVKFDQVKITITNGDGEVFGIYQILNAQEAEALLHELRSYEHDPVITEPEPTSAEDIVNDLVTALKSFIKEEEINE